MFCSAFIVSIIERPDEKSLPQRNQEVQFYGRLLLRFCKVCILAQSHLFPVSYRRRTTSEEQDRAGLPVTACIIWGDMGVSYQARVRPEVGNGRTYIVSTSLPYPNRDESRQGRLRQALCQLRRDDFVGAIPSLQAVEPAAGVKPSFGHCAEHSTFVA